MITYKGRSQALLKPINRADHVDYQCRKIFNGYTENKWAGRKKILRKKRLLNVKLFLINHFNLFSKMKINFAQYFILYAKRIECSEIKLE